MALSFFKVCVRGSVGVLVPILIRSVPELNQDSSVNFDSVPEQNFSGNLL